ncbi:GNAT family N-acetyltransferase [Arthrobacter sp. AL12]|uniref:GNAT family N-acetyltransferase n=1 Tax=Arthrobacter sp. AL12 TaxID=3042241 RepID=UPI00249B5C19|nr:GNAT family N-acetyltransferase [Arthrobacter sp. AL12]MDI3211605.1 GNAT family N-acetyltransferase [Arthrobacter sp. AL12]
MPFTLREPALLDAPQIAELHVATWRETYSHLLPEDFFTQEHVQSRHQMWHHILGNPREEWSITGSRRAGGRSSASRSSAPAFGPKGKELPLDRQLFSICVTSERYGTRVGQALLDATAGDGPAMLWVARDNLRAVAFYLRKGFEFDGAEQTGPGAPAIVDARMVR